MPLVMAREVCFRVRAERRGALLHSPSRFLETVVLVNQLRRSIAIDRGPGFRRNGLNRYAGRLRAASNDGMHAVS